MHDGELDVYVWNESNWIPFRLSRSLRRRRVVESPITPGVLIGRNRSGYHDGAIHVILTKTVTRFHDLGVRITVEMATRYVVIRLLKRVDQLYFARFRGL